jgi:hypothetical protein
VSVAFLEITRDNHTTIILLKKIVTINVEEFPNVEFT